MILYPAIDMKDGKCVRLLQGRANDVTVFGDDPFVMAQKWKQEGAQYLHLVDLDGAFTGKSENLMQVKRIAQNIGIPTQLGGGIRTMADIENRLEQVGVTRVILGTVATENLQLVKEAAQRYPDRIVVGIDTKDGFVTVRGWVDKTTLTPVEFAMQMGDVGIKTIIYTDISKDGMMSGPDLRGTTRMVQETGLEIIASGGVSSLADILAVKEIGAQGVILGKALYTGAVSLQEGIYIAK